MNTPDDFSLISPAPKHGRQLFSRPLSAYAALYGTQERQLKNWLRKGRTAKPVDLPPLEDASAMPAWWTRHFTRAVPDKILAAAKSPPATIQAPPAHSGVPTAATPPLAQAKSLPSTKSPRAVIEDFDAVVGLDLADSVERMRKNLAIIQRDYEAALTDPNCDESTLTMRGGRLDKCIERLRKLEGTLDDLRKSREELIDRASATEELRRVHTAMASSLEGLIVARFGIDRAGARLFVDQWFENLRQSRFFAPTHPSEPLAGAA